MSSLVRSSIGCDTDTNVPGTSTLDRVLEHLRQPVEVVRASSTSSAASAVRTCRCCRCRRRRSRPRRGRSWPSVVTTSGNVWSTFSAARSSSRASSSEMLGARRIVDDRVALVDARHELGARLREQPKRSRRAQRPRPPMNSAAQRRMRGDERAYSGRDRSIQRGPCHLAAARTARAAPGRT